MKRRALISAATLLLLTTAVLAVSHPGHEYHIEGTVTKMRSPHFEVKDAKGNTGSFMIVPGTEVSLNNVRATATEIAVGVQAEVDGVENDRGIVEATKVKLTR